jgi:hypothetical protein
MDFSETSPIIIPDGFIDFKYEKVPLNPSQEPSKSVTPAGAAAEISSSDTAAQAADRVLGPEESISVTLTRVSSFLEQALAAFGADQGEQGCVHLEEAANLLEILVAAVVPNAGKPAAAKIEEEAPQSMAAQEEEEEAPRAMAAAA